MKTCSKCKVEKDESEFYKNKILKSGLRSECKKCVKIYNNSDSAKKSMQKYLATESAKIKRIEAGKKFRKTDKYKELLKSEKTKKYMADYQKLERVRLYKCTTPSYIKRCLNVKKDELIPKEIMELKAIQLKLIVKMKGLKNENQQH